MKVAVIIILYNEYINDSIAYNSLKSQDVDIYLFDNSTEKKYLIENKKKEKYYTLKKNVGLSVAYNYIIDMIKNKYFYIITSDSDTEYPSTYLDVLKKNIGEELVYLPVIIDKRKKKVCYPVIKENKYKTLVHKKIYNPDKAIGYFESINSGVIYNTKIFDFIRFNEKLLVENIDYDIFQQIYFNNVKSKIIDTELKQDFSGHSGDFLLEGRVKYTYNDHLIYYGKIWYLIILVVYLKKTIFSFDLKYLKGYYNIYIRKEKNAKK